MHVHGGWKRRQRVFAEYTIGIINSDVGFIKGADMGCLTGNGTEL